MNNDKKIKKELDMDSILTYYNIDDIQRIFKLDSKQKAYKLCRTEGFPAIKIGRDIRVNKEALEEYIRAKAFRKNIIDLQT